MISYLEAEKEFHLITNNLQLTLGILPSGHVALNYFGKKIGTTDLNYVIKEIQRASYLADTDSIKNFKLEQLPLVYPAYGNPDLRTPAFQFELSDGSRLSDFRYRNHQIYQGKKQITGLPSSFAKACETLELSLMDQVSQIELVLRITAFPEFDMFAQHVTVKNHSPKAFNILRMMSLNCDFLTDDFELLTLTGAWGRETQISRQKIRQGFQGIDSKRGASGHGQNPFIALLNPKTTADSGEAYGFNLVYSGNFIANCEVDMHQNTRVQLGINPFEFNWTLASQEEFSTPEALMTFTDQGLNQLSQIYHRFLTNCLINPNFAKKERPILLNNWEATYFDFDQKTLLALAAEAKKVGVELFVLDDGWFGKRDDDTSSLGDWVPNNEKLGGSLSELIAAVNALGLDFGLWVEPEMVSKNSQLFTEHPDWIIAVAGRTPQQVRNQYVLDLSRSEVQDHIIASLSTLLAENKIKYLKWDMNRNLTDLGSRALPFDRQGELSHRYILGVYRILETLVKRFPELLIEGCAGGGGRFDAGMLYYTPQIWTSDDTDAVARLGIQAGTSLAYPPAAMSCHVSAVPNHQVGRITTLKTRAVVAAQGNFGYELDLLHLTEADKKIIAEQIEVYKKYRSVFQFGQHFSLETYRPENHYAWLKKTADLVIVSHVTLLVEPNTVMKRLKLTNLAAAVKYQDLQTKQIYSGAELLHIGLAVPKPTHDYFATQWFLRVVD